MAIDPEVKEATLQVVELARGEKTCGQSRSEETALVDELAANKSASVLEFKAREFT